MELRIKVYGIEKNIQNNTLSEWDSSGNIPLGWSDYREVKAVGGGNFGYLCSFNYYGHENSYIQIDTTQFIGSYSLYFNYIGIFGFRTKFVDGTYQYHYFSSTTAFKLQKVDLSLTDVDHVRFFKTTNANTYLDFVSLLPEGYPTEISFRNLNVNNILEIDSLTRAIEDDLFSFVSDNISFTIFDGAGDGSHQSIEEMKTSKKLYRMDIYYNNGVKEFNFMYFTDPTNIVKKMQGGLTTYEITAFELTTYFKINGWYLGTLQNTLNADEEIESQEYHYLVEGYNTIEQIINNSILEAKKFLIAEYIPVEEIISDVTVVNSIIESSFSFPGRIIDVYYNAVRDRTFIIVVVSESQLIYEIRFNSLFLIDEKPFGYLTKFVDPGSHILATVAIVGTGYGDINGIHHVIAGSTGYSLYGVYWYYGQDNNLNAHGEYVHHIEIDTLTFYRFGITEEGTPFVSADNPLPQERFTNEVNGIVNDYQFNYNASNFEIHLYDFAGDEIVQYYTPGSILFNNDRSLINYTVSLLPSGLSDYTATNMTFIGLLKDLAIIQNAYFYFTYSGNNIIIVFHSRGYSDDPDSTIISLYSCSKNESTHDFIDYSRFETETFKNLISMKRSLLAYYRNFYGNGLEILKLTVNSILSLSLGDIVTVGGKKYIIRQMEQEIGYKSNSDFIEIPPTYLELMEVKYN
jgi:hypothetical protein